MMRRRFLVLATLAGFFSWMPLSFGKEPSWIDVEIDGIRHKLDVLIQRPTDAPGPFPIALISHGAPGRQDPREITTDLLAGWVRSFAARGYLAVAVMRRGFGRSSGDPTDRTGTCANPEPGRYFNEDQKDLAAALDVISRRSDADPTRVIGLGHSGGGMTMLALSAQSHARLSLAINVSGGLYRFEEGAPAKPFAVYEGCELFADAVVARLAEMGKQNRTQSLWLYARNDPLFRPGFVRSMYRAWATSGNDADLSFLPSYEPNGHRMFVQSKGQGLLLAKIDPVLRAKALPTWDPSRFAPMKAVLTAEQADKLDMYLAMHTSHKAFAIPFTADGKGYWWTWGYSTKEMARTKAKAGCEEANRAPCRVIVEDFDVAVSPAEVAAARGTAN